jgi:hypothetical protein
MGQKSNEKDRKNLTTKPQRAQRRKKKRKIQNYKHEFWTRITRILKTLVSFVPWWHSVCFYFK